MRTLVLEVVKQEKDPYHIYFLKEGYEALWSTIVEKEGMEVRYNVDIVGVTRTGYGGVTIHTRDRTIINREHCDFMVWTPPMTELLKVLHYPTSNEWDFFSRLQATVTTASVFTSKGLVRHSPYTVFMENVMRMSPDHQVTACFDWEGIVNKPNVTEYDKERGPLTTVCLQQGGSRTSRQTVEKKLRQHFAGGFNSSDIEVLHSQTWNFFHRFLNSLMSTFAQMESRRREAGTPLGRLCKPGSISVFSPPTVFSRAAGISGTPAHRWCLRL